ncbi:MAG TPA: amidohydrolase family protein [Candidatus Microbacterium pullistercoris]|nr:amidohydrolase family protein [Candidatus Microbacterium pullistercoris]
MTLEFSPDYRRIATEEAWASPRMLEVYRREFDAGRIDDPGFTSLWGFYLGSTERASSLTARIVDTGEQRLAAMDAAGVDAMVLATTAPGVQALRKEVALPLAREINDELAEAVAAHPTRYHGLTSIAPQDPEAAAEEIRRGHDKLGFNGVILNSHVQGEYLDDRRFDPIFAAAEELDTPIYLHPTTPIPRLAEPFIEAGLDGAVYGFGVEAGLHTLRLITSGLFDRHPKLKLVLGHLGEALPFWMWRLDFMHATSVRSQRYEAIKPLELPISGYLKRNIWITTSGMPWHPAVTFVREAVGLERLMFAWDYPYQWNPDEVATYETLAWPTEDKRQFFQTTAEEVFGLARRAPRG